MAVQLAISRVQLHAEPAAGRRGVDPKAGHDGAAAEHARGEHRRSHQRSGGRQPSRKTRAKVRVLNPLM